MKKINNAFSIALEYVNKIDLSDVTKDNVNDWTDKHRKELEAVSKEYLADTRLNWQYTNEYAYLVAFECAFEHAIEKKAGAPISSWEIAKKLIVANPQYPHNAYDPKVSQYPDELMAQYRVLLDQQPIKFGWSSKENRDSIWKEIFMCAWHDGEKIPQPTILGIRQDVFIVSAVLLSLYILLK